MKEIKEESIINNVHVPEEEYTGNSGMRVLLHFLGQLQDPGGGGD